MRNFHLIDQSVDVQSLLAELDARPDLWDRHKVRKEFPNQTFAQASDIWVRYNDILRLEDDNRAAWNGEHVPIWYPAWRELPALRPIVFNLMAKLQGEMLGGVLITKVPAHSQIRLHTDGGWHVNYYDKFYLTLRNPPECRFICDDGHGEEALIPKPGEIWLFDNRIPHKVENDGNSERITLIMCIRTGKFGRP